MWFDSPTPISKGIHGRPPVDKAQLLDPLFKLYSEVEHPTRMRAYVKKWRSGAEMRFKMPYYPETKTPSNTFKYS